MGSSLSASKKDRSKPEDLGSELSDRINKQIREDAIRARYEHKVLLLGSSQSGKTTLVKQMRISHGKGLSADEFAEYRPVVYENLLDSARQIVLYIQKTGVRCACDPSGVLAQKILDYRLEAEFSYEIAEAIHQLWNDAILVKVLDGRSSGLYLVDSTKHFLNGALRIGSPNYLPNEQDVLKARQKHIANGVVETRFQTGKTIIRVIDVRGQRTERRRWLYQFYSVTSILFVAALDEYAEVQMEDDAVTQNRLAESLALFESVVNSLWSPQTSIILMLTKVDVFTKKLPKVPLERYFPEYTGGADVDKAAKYILSKFTQANKARLTIYSHLTQATDPINIRLLFSHVKDTELQNHLSRDTGLL